MYHCVINDNNEVVNVVLWDGKSEWNPGPGLRAIADPSRKGSIFDLYDPETNTFSKKS